MACNYPKWKATVAHLELPPHRRILAVSDIHGNVEFLDRLLEKAAFSTDDILFVVGDILEKGPNSLGTLRRLMELSKTHTVHTLRGNCDQIFLDFMAGRGWGKEMLWHVVGYWGERSFITQLARAADFPLNGPDDFDGLRQVVKERFAAEWAFLEEAPVVIETQNQIFVHGGVPREDRLEELDGHPLMKNDNFLGQGRAFKKWIVVGHWPVTLYQPRVPLARPLIQRQRHIISIDGGNVLKADGQLNALVIPNADSEDFSYISYDGLPTAIALDDQEATKDSVNIRWGKSAVEVLRREEELSWCRHRETGREMWILNDYLFDRADGVHCEDSTDYQLPVQAGEEITVVRRTRYGTLAKKDGATGWYFGRLKEE